MGHRNILGLDWDASGRLWDLEHGRRAATNSILSSAAPIMAGRSAPTANITMAIRSPIIRRIDGFAQPAVSWSPVIAPGDMIIYSGAMFEAWQDRP